MGLALNVPQPRYAKTRAFFRSVNRHERALLAARSKHRRSSCQLYDQGSGIARRRQSAPPHLSLRIMLADVSTAGFSGTTPRLFFFRAPVCLVGRSVWRELSEQPSATPSAASLSHTTRTGSWLDLRPRGFGDRQRFHQKVKRPQTLLDPTLVGPSLAFTHHSS